MKLPSSIPTLAALHLAIAIQAAPPPELTVLRTQYDKVVAERVTAPFEAAKSDLDTKFIGALERAANDVKKTGDLEAVLAINGDKKRLTDKLPIPGEDDDKTPEALKKLRGIYREQLKKLEDQRSANHQAILPPYTDKLKALETTLTKADRIDEATEVKAYRDGLSVGATAAQPTVAAAPVDEPKAAGNVAAKTKARGDDRKAAEWVLGIGGKVGVWDNQTASHTVFTPDDLPRGKFSLRTVHLDNNSGAIKPVTDDDFQILAGLERLESLTTNKLAITPAAFEVLASCPALKEIQMQYNRFGDDLWAHLAGLKQLKKFVQGFDGLPVRGIGVSNLNGSTMEDLVLGSNPIVDDAMKEIAQLPNLKVLILENTKITDAGMPSLAGLKKLAEFNVRGTNVTAAGLAALKGSPLVRIGYGITIDDFTSSLPQVTALFPKVVELAIPREVAPSSEDWKKIAGSSPHTKKIFVTSHVFGDSSCEGMEVLTDLETLELIYAPITDAGISALSRIKKLRWLKVQDGKLTDACLDTLGGMKKLEYIGLPKAGKGITAEAIARFKKKRPDVKVDS